MALSEIATEKLHGRITNVHIGYDATHGVNISSGILGFEFDRIHDAAPAHQLYTKTTANMYQGNSHITWRLRFLSDAAIAFYATDVQVAGGNQFALNNEADSNKIEYFKVIMTIENSSGVSKTRTYTLADAYCLGSRGVIGSDEDAQIEYFGVARNLTPADA